MRIKNKNDRGQEKLKAVQHEAEQRDQSMDRGIDS